MSRKVTQYKPEFKQQAVNQALTGGLSVAQTARNLGVNENTLHTWVSKYDQSIGKTGNQSGEPDYEELKRLRKENKRLRQERDLLKSSGVLCQSQRVKCAWIQSNRHLAPLTMMCGTLEVSRSGYHDWCLRGLSRRDSDDRDHLGLIKTGFEKGKGCYGTRRLKRELAADGVVLSRRRIGRLMESANLACKTRKKRRPQTTDSRHDKPIAENFLKREFDVPQTDQAYVGDITYIDTEEGWLYLAVWIDLCSRAVVGWSMQKHMRSELVCDALRMAIGSRHCPAGLIVHSDRGSQYASDEFRRLLVENGFIASMSAKGDCWDNGGSFGIRVKSWCAL